MFVGEQAGLCIGGHEYISMRIDGRFREYPQRGPAAADLGRSRERINVQEVEPAMV